jgi:hypothetical protein
MRAKLHLDLRYRKYDAPPHANVLWLAWKWIVLLVAWKSNWQGDERMIYAQL